jgi:hypothetical protein
MRFAYADPPYLGCGQLPAAMPAPAPVPGAQPALFTWEDVA